MASEALGVLEGSLEEEREEFFPQQVFQSMERVHLNLYSTLSNSVHIVQTTNTVTEYRNVVMLG